MSRPRLLDLFCCAGGAAMGYHRAGFDVVGVDKVRQPRYPFQFVQADALEYLAECGHCFDAIHASPPCQRYSFGTPDKSKHPNLLPAVREALQSVGKPWAIENVPGAPMSEFVVLCGSMFGLATSCGAELRRHRWFETSFDTDLVPHCEHGWAGKRIICVYGGKGRDRRRKTITVTGHGTTSGNREANGHNFSTAQMREAMGIDWMNRDELSQAIPPAYTEWIGRQLMENLR